MRNFRAIFDIEYLIHYYFFVSEINENSRQPCKNRKINRGSAATVLDGTLTAKDGTSWRLVSPTAPVAGRIGQHNVLKECPGPTAIPKRKIMPDSKFSSFSLLIDNFIIEHIIQCTEIEAQTKLSNPEWKVSKEEIYALIAVMYARGVLAKGQPVDMVWSKRWGAPIIAELMSRNRYKELLKYLQFDVRTSRSERVKTDKFALFSTVWNRFIENCKVMYRPNENITIDEQLFPTKARYPFTQYIASKPDKFGIKFWLAVDAKTKYLVNGFPYLGKDLHRSSSESLSEHVVMALMEPFLNCGRNVTTDNFFTSMKLAVRLEKKKTSIVGTVNRVRREIPTEIRNSKEPRFSSKVLQSNKATLTVYQGKPSKNVLLLSTLHRTVLILDGPKKIPESIAFYNDTKFGVDIIDQMARLYTTKVASRRWPMQCLYNVLDFAAINAFVLYKEVANVKITRREFILALIMEILQNNKPNVEEEISGGIEASAVQESDISDCSNSRKRTYCQMKKPNGPCRNKTNKTCNKCKKFLCGKCTARKNVVLVCKECSM